jgi:hypothetical protein
VFILAASCPQFAQREFCFTLENDVYRRYLSFSNHIEFEKELIKLCPEKIDIGAVYSAKVVFFSFIFFKLNSFSFSQKIIKCFRQHNSILSNVNLSLILI